MKKSLTDPVRYVSLVRPDGLISERGPGDGG